MFVRCRRTDRRNPRRKMCRNLMQRNQHKSTRCAGHKIRCRKMNLPSLSRGLTPASEREKLSMDDYRRGLGRQQQDDEGTSSRYPVLIARQIYKILAQDTTGCGRRKIPTSNVLQRSQQRYRSPLSLGIGRYLAFSLVTAGAGCNPTQFKCRSSMKVRTTA